MSAFEADRFNRSRTSPELVVGRWWVVSSFFLLDSVSTLSIVA
jgi:hypothetical protein